MELDNNELTTVICALENAIIYSKLIAESQRNDIFLKPDFVTLKAKIEKWQKRNVKQTKPIILNI